MTSVIFSDWLIKFDRQMRVENRSVLLLLDNAPSHSIPDPTCLRNVKVHFLPPNTTAHLQPLDAGIIRNVKCHYNRRAMQHRLDVADGTETGDLDIRRALEFLRNAWNDVKPETIANCWRHTKILPVPTTETEAEAPMEVTSLVEVDHLLRKMDPDTTVHATDLLACDENIATEEEMTDEAIVDIVKTSQDGLNDEAEEDPIDDSEPPPKVSMKEFRRSLTSVKDFIGQHLDVFNVQHLDYLNAIKEKSSEINCDTQKIITDYFKKV